MTIMHHGSDERCHVEVTSMPSSNKPPLNAQIEECVFANITLHSPYV